MFYPIFNFLSYTINSYPLAARDGANNININDNEHLIFLFYTITKTATAPGRILPTSGRQIFTPRGTLVVHRYPHYNIFYF